jgi:hypothetical protein
MGLYYYIVVAAILATLIGGCAAVGVAVFVVFRDDKHAFPIPRRPRLWVSRLFEVGTTCIGLTAVIFSSAVIADSEWPLLGHAMLAALIGLLVAGIAIVVTVATGILHDLAVSEVQDWDDTCGSDPEELILVRHHEDGGNLNNTKKEVMN